MPPVTCRHCGKTTAAAVLCLYCGKHLEEQVACPKCSRKLVAGSRSCPYCGAAVVAQPPPELTACAKCGRKMAAHLQRCQVCGTPAPGEKAAEGFPRSAGFEPYARANELLNRMKAAEALVEFDLALAADPLLTPAWCDRAVAFAMLQRYDESLASALRAIELAPSRHLSWMNRALAEDGLGRKAEAIRSYQEFLKLAPPTAQRQAAIAMRRIAALSG
jgi:Tfp pilus assembly protein PilF